MLGWRNVVSLPFKGRHPVSFKARNAVSLPFKGRARVGMG
jgi:hypothetical protein